MHILAADGTHCALSARVRVRVHIAMLRAQQPTARANMQQSTVLQLASAQLKFITTYGGMTQKYTSSFPACIFVSITSVDKPLAAIPCFGVSGTFSFGVG